MSNVNPKLTIGMATYDDFDGTYFTIQAIRAYHPEVADQIEFIILDNNPAGPCGEPLRHFSGYVPRCRYVPSHYNQGTASRDLIFRLATTPYVVCVDSHILILPGAIARLIAYFDTHPDSIDLLQGPLIYDDLESISTHFKPGWSGGMYGTWDTDSRGLDSDSAPFEIPMQGLGLFACTQKAWRGFNPRFTGFGGEEGYIHEKFRRGGGKNLCLPFLRWVHRFQRPGGTSYPNIWKDRIRNYLIGLDELGENSEEVIDHFREHIGVELTDNIVEEIQSEMDGPFHFFDAIYCINLDSEGDRWINVQRRFEAVGIPHRVRRFSAIATENHHIGCALSHRSVIEDAMKRGFENVLIFEDDAIFLDETRSYLNAALGELTGRDWELLYLGAHRWGGQAEAITGCQHLVKPTVAPTCNHAIAYHHGVFARLLEELPASIEDMEEWISVHHGIDQYMGQNFRCLLTEPAVVSQPPLLAQENPEFRDRFVLGDEYKSILKADVGNAVYFLRSTYGITVFEEKLIVYSKTGKKTVSMDPSSGLVLELMDGKRRTKDIIDILQTAYPEAAPAIKEDVEKTVAFLLNQEILIQV
jgi:hypothetical protein